MNTLRLDGPAGRQRRRHSAEFKASVVEACRQPGVSMASVALANGLNATMLRKWVVQSGGLTAQPAAYADPAAVAQFVPVTLPAPVGSGSDIRIELQRGDTRITASWPCGAAAECAGWLRELLR